MEAGEEEEVEKGREGVKKVQDVWKFLQNVNSKGWWSENMVESLLGWYNSSVLMYLSVCLYIWCYFALKLNEEIFIW